MWAGGDVSLVAGNAISSKLKLFTICGSTEMGLWPTLRRDGPWQSDQGKFMILHPAMNMAFHRRSDGLFEGIFGVMKALRKSSASSKSLRCFKNTIPATSSPLILVTLNFGSTAAVPMICKFSYQERSIIPPPLSSG